MRKIERLPIDSDLLHTFVQIAESGTLTAAAERLGRTQSAISVQLRKLETGLKTPVFTRSARGMILTPEGEALLSRARVILSQMRETAAMFRDPLSGVIRVGLPDDFDDTVLEELLSSFARAHPGVEVRAQSGCTVGYPAALRAGKMDVAVCSGLENHPGGHSLGQEEIVWAGSDGRDWSQMRVLPLAVLERQCYWRDLPAERLETAGRGYTVAFRSSSFPSLRAALRAGLAIGILPRNSVDDGLQILTEVQGVPPLPSSHRAILRSDQAPQALAAEMVRAIRAAYHP